MVGLGHFEFHQRGILVAGDFVFSQVIAPRRTRLIGEGAGQMAQAPSFLITPLRVALTQFHRSVVQPIAARDLHRTEGHGAATGQRQDQVGRLTLRDRRSRVVELLGPGDRGRGLRVQVRHRRRPSKEKRKRKRKRRKEGLLACPLPLAPCPLPLAPCPFSSCVPDRALRHRESPRRARCAPPASRPRRRRRPHRSE